MTKSIKMSDAINASILTNQIHRYLTFWSGDMEWIACYYVAFLLGVIAGGVFMHLIYKAVEWYETEF